ncbi:alanine--tRNA ligase, partial [Vibrio cholerae CP1035(8)]
KFVVTTVSKPTS